MIKKDIWKQFDRKNVLVTGGTGMIGRKICDLLTENTSAHVVSVSMDRITKGDSKKMVYLYGDLSDFKGFYDVLKENNIHYVFHTAGIKGSPKMTKEKPASFFVPLLQMNTNVLEASRMAGVKKLIYTSSIGAYPAFKIIDQLEGFDIYKPLEVFKESDNGPLPPMDEYPGYAKRMGEYQIDAYKIQYGLNYKFVRLGNVYGEGDNFDADNAMVIPSLISKINNRVGLKEVRETAPVIVLGDGSAIRDFCYSEDIAKGIILALMYDGGKTSTFYNLGAGKGFSIKEVVENLKDITPFEYNYSEEKSKPSKRILDTTLAQQELSFNPEIILRKGLERTWKWYIENPQEHLLRKNYFK
tara:strand:- start:16805 stop:17872 length:1068 start_codon:yes stop_codon:yes gene_type:complete